MYKDGHRTFWPGFGPVQRRYSCNSRNFRVPKWNRHLFPHWARFETGPDSSLWCVTRSASFKKFRKSAPRWSGTESVLVFASSKKHAGRNNFSWDQSYSRSHQSKSYFFRTMFCLALLTFCWARDISPPQIASLPWNRCFLGEFCDYPHGCRQMHQRHTKYYTISAA